VALTSGQLATPTYQVVTRPAKMLAKVLPLNVKMFLQLLLVVIVHNVTAVTGLMLPTLPTLMLLLLVPYRVRVKWLTVLPIWLPKLSSAVNVPSVMPVTGQLHSTVTLTMAVSRLVKIQELVTVI